MTEIKMSCLLLKVLGRMCVRSFGICQILSIYPRLLESVAGGLTSGDSCHSFVLPPSLSFPKKYVLFWWFNGLYHFSFHRCPSNCSSRSKSLHPITMVRISTASRQASDWLMIFNIITDYYNHHDDHLWSDYNNHIVGKTWWESRNLFWPKLGKQIRSNLENYEKLQVWPRKERKRDSHIIWVEN